MRGLSQRLSSDALLQSVAVAMLSRSSSWPVVRRPPADACIAPLLPGPNAPSPIRKPPPILDPRKTATLSRHYYPEGGWGWVVVGCSVGVHVLNHGLQLGGGAVLLSAAVTAFHSSATDAGTWHVEAEHAVLVCVAAGGGTETSGTG